MVEAAISPIILILTLYLVLTLKIKKEYINYPHLLFQSTLFSLLIIGIFSGLVYFGETTFSISNLLSALREILTSCAIFYVFSLYISSLTSEQKMKTLWFLFSLFLITTSFGMLESIFGFRAISADLAYDTERIIGFFGNPNLTGLQANFTLSLLLGLFLTKRINVFFTLLFIPVIVYSSLASFSKTAIITSSLLLVIFFLLCIYNIFKFRDKKKAISSLVLVSTIFLVITFVILPIALDYYNQLGTGQQKRLTNISNMLIKGEFNRKTTSVRSDIFRDGIEIIKTNPVIGHGLATFSVGGMFKSSITHGIHNTYLKLIGEAGIIPLLLYLLFYLIFIISIIKSKSFNLKIGGLFIILCFFLYSFTSHNALEDKFAIALIGVTSGFLNKR